VEDQIELFVSHYEKPFDGDEHLTFDNSSHISFDTGLETGQVGIFIILLAFHSLHYFFNGQFITSGSTQQSGYGCVFVSVLRIS